MLAGIIASSVAGTATKVVKKAIGKAIEKKAREVLGVPKTAPVSAVDEALRKNPQALEAVMQASAEIAEHEANAHAVAMQAQAQVNIAAIASDDPFVRRARPTLVYALTAITVYLALIGGYLAVFAYDKMQGHIEFIQAFAIPLSMAWAAVGVVAWRRSTDKQTAMGMKAPSVFGLFGK